MMADNFNKKDNQKLTYPDLDPDIKTIFKKLSEEPDDDLSELDRHIFELAHKKYKGQKKTIFEKLNIFLHFQIREQNSWAFHLKNSLILRIAIGSIIIGLFLIGYLYINFIYNYDNRNKNIDEQIVKPIEHTKPNQPLQPLPERTPDVVTTPNKQKLEKPNSLRKKIPSPSFQVPHAEPGLRSTAVNLELLSIRTIFIGEIGDDEWSNDLEQQLKKNITKTTELELIDLTQSPDAILRTSTEEFDTIFLINIKGGKPLFQMKISRQTPPPIEAEKIINNLMLSRKKAKEARK